MLFPARLVQHSRRLIRSSCVMALLAAGITAHAQTSPFAPIVGNTTVGTATSVPVPVPLSITLASLAALYGPTVIYSTTDPFQQIVITSFNLGNDLQVTMQELYDAYPDAVITLTGVSATKTGDARLSLSQGTCAAPSGATCTMSVGYSGASPAGTATAKVLGQVAGVTISNAGTFGAFANLLYPVLSSVANSYLVFDVQVVIAKLTQAIVFGTTPTIAFGGTATVSATGGASGNPVTFTSTTPSTCSVSGTTVTAIAAGTCTIAANQAGNVDYLAAPQVTRSLVVPPATSIPRLGNISTRLQVLTGNDVMIGGFVIGGSAPKAVVVRARGPSLIPFGIANALANPTLQLVRSSDQVTIASNDDWGSAANAAAITASGFAPGNAFESAIHAALPPGAYTAIVSGSGGGTGVGIVEVFEVDHAEIPLLNISTRGQVLTGNDVMIGGFVIQGDGPQTVVIRARGPSLVPFGITNALADPIVQLVRSSDSVTLATNDNWGSAANAADITASGFAPSNALEAAIRTTLEPGAYTVIVTGAGAGVGVAIVEIFAN